MILTSDCATVMSRATVLFDKHGNKRTFKQLLSMGIVATAMSAFVVPAYAGPVFVPNFSFEDQVFATDPSAGVGALSWTDSCTHNQIISKAY